MGTSINEHSCHGFNITNYLRKMGTDISPAALKQSKSNILRPKNLPLLVPRFLLGLRTDVTGNVHFLNDDDIIYPVGSVISVYNLHQRRQKFIRLANRGRNVNIITISPNKKLIAVAEEGTKPFITIWCTQTFKKKNVLTLPSEKEINATKFVAIAFSTDSKWLYTVTGESDWYMYVFKIERARLISTARANNFNGTGEVSQIATNPTDINTVALIGKNLLKILACVDFTWRQYGFNKTDNWHFTSAVWLSQERLICGDINGKILFLENGDLKNVFTADELPVINLKVKDELQVPSQTNIKSTKTESLTTTSATTLSLNDEDQSIRSMLLFPRGLAFVYLTGTVHFYEMITPLKFVRRNIFKVPDNKIHKNDLSDTNTIPMNSINCLCINPSQNRLLVTCQQSQIFSVNLWLQDYNTAGEIEFTEYGPALHHGPIASIAVCYWKPILLTAGKYDRKLKIWNYEDGILDIEQRFVDDLYSVALHPTGLYCLVGFTDKLRFFTIMVEEFLVIKEFPIRLCRYCCFSNLGGQFAATNANLIQVYSTITLEIMYILKGHSGLITGISWLPDDTKMASSGHDGAVYEWLIIKEERLNEIIVKNVLFTDVAIKTDGHTIYAVSNDGHLRELLHSNIIRDILINSNDAGLHSITLSHIDQMMFIGGPDGIVYNMKLPLAEKPEYDEIAMFATNVTHMKISFDDRYLLTATESGELCFFKLLNTEDKAVKIDKDFKISKDILIAKNLLEDHLQQIKNQQLRLKELEIEYHYQLRQNETIYDMKINDLHNNYKQIINELTEKIEYLENEHAKDLHKINMEIETTKQEHHDFIKNLETNYNEKLIYEYEKYQRLEKKMDRLRVDYEQQLDDLTRDKIESERLIVEDFLMQLQQKNDEIDELTMKYNRQTEIHETIKQQIEDDADREIVDLKTTHTKQLNDEQNVNIHLQSQQTILRKKLWTLEKQCDDFKIIINKLTNKQEKFRKLITELERDCNDLKNEIYERDLTIQNKEKRIVELKLKNQELEKYQYILNCKIDEFKIQIEPKDKLIQQQQEQINDMIKELENLQKIIINLDVQMKSLQEKLKAANIEREKEMNKNDILKTESKRIKIKIYEASRNIQNIPILLKIITELTEELRKDTDFEQLQFEDRQVRDEFQRQREFLENTIATLKRQLNREINQKIIENKKTTKEKTVKVRKNNENGDDMHTENQATTSKI